MYPRLRLEGENTNMESTYSPVIAALSMRPVVLTQCLAHRKVLFTIVPLQVGFSWCP
jgi:hypothetical protein